MSRILTNLCLVAPLIVSLSLHAMAAERFGVSKTDTRASVLFNKLQNARNELEGRSAEDAVWQFWFSQAPDADIRTSLDAGIERREAYDYEAAEEHFDNVVRMAPEYAEGFNQRAFIRFLRQNYAGAQADLETALDLAPRHFGALSGMYHVLLRQNRVKPALRMLQRAVAIHPWLKERFALPADMWPENYRALQEPRQEI